MKELTESNMATGRCALPGKSRDSWSKHEPSQKIKRKQVSTCSFTSNHHLFTQCAVFLLYNLTKNKTLMFYKKKILLDFSVLKGHQPCKLAF